MPQIHRTPQAIAADIRREYPHNTSSWIYARPYIQAMDALVSWKDVYGPSQETADEIGRRFLSNAGAWRGDTARKLKNEIRAALGMPLARNFKD